MTHGIIGPGRLYDVDELYAFVKRETAQRGMKISLRALDYACEKHEGQVRKGGQPYIVHPLWMAQYLLLLEDSAVTDVMVATSLLHDVPEERLDISVDDLPFGLEVRDAVAHLVIIKHTGEQTFARRIRGAEMLSQNGVSAVVRAVDMLDILHTIPQAFELEPDRIRKIVLEDHALKIPKLVEASKKWPEVSALMMRLIEEINGIIYAYAVIYKIKLDDPKFVNAPDAKDYTALLY